MKRQQIIGMYELDGLEAEEIARVLDMELEIVRDVLAASSLLFQSRVEGGTEARVTKADVKEAVCIAKELMRDETAGSNVRLKAAMWVVDEGTGRNDAKANVALSVHAGMLALNDKLRQMRALKVATVKAIDV